jgi:hypothetical protein
MKLRHFVSTAKLLILFALAALCSCASKPQNTSKSSRSNAIIRHWEGRSFDRVVGYKFVDLPGWRSVVCNGSNQLDLAGLQRAKRKEVVLSEAEIDHLWEAIFSRNPPPDRAMCYEPHHIFIFFAKDEPIGAFEVCFQCSDSRGWPKRNINVNESYQKLGALCERIGLGTKAPLTWRIFFNRL